MNQVFISRGRVLIVEDSASLAALYTGVLENDGYEVVHAASGESAVTAFAEQSFDVILLDLELPGMSGMDVLDQLRQQNDAAAVIVITAHGSVEVAVECMAKGVLDFLEKPVNAPRLSLTVSNAQKQSNLQSQVKTLRATYQPDGFEGFVGASQSMQSVYTLIRNAAPSKAPIFIVGESGTGKEVCAEAIHQESKRKDKPFVAINCAAIPENMLEAILFGHEKGAFTGAHASRPGKFEQAQGGTLLLDEISEMALDLQAKLLRVLQEKEVERIGGQSAVPLDIRVLATTNRDLRAHVADGKFREDLYYRLSVFPLNLPPLRERRGDVVPLAELFLNDSCAGNRPAPQISSAAQASLLAYDFPGNVRELQNLMQRAVIMCGGQQIEEHDLRFEAPFARTTTTHEGPVTVTATATASADADKRLQDGLQSAEGQMIIEALQAVGGNRKRSAEDLGISPRTLRYKLARLRDAGYEIPGRA